MLSFLLQDMALACHTAVEKRVLNGMEWGWVDGPG